MKSVPRHIVKKLKFMMPYWRNQLRREFQYQHIHAEASVKTPSEISYDRQKEFIQAQNERLKQQLLNPVSYFAQRPKTNA